MQRDSRTDETITEGLDSQQPKKKEQFLMFRAKDLREATEGKGSKRL